MESIEYVDPVNGRKYEALREGEEVIKMGPPEGLVDALNLTEPFATNLHNVLYRRHIFTYADATRGNVLIGALQEALNMDVQRLTEAFMTFEKEVVP